MKKLPLGIQSYRKIIENDFLYVDKTQYIYELVNGAGYYFFSRPRRFGKSLLLDTICEVMRGDKELFKGLFIYNTDYNFIKYPVLRIDMSGIANDSPESLKASLSNELTNRIKDENLDISSGIVSDLFKNLIEALYKKYGQRVAVFIDEYDKPILDHLGNEGITEANREFLRNFYGILKSSDSNIRMAFITGVTKFTKTSLFSGMNNLRDITLEKKFANICGITIENLNEYFKEHIRYVSGLDEFENDISTFDRILYWYDGYSWDGNTKIINPYSLFSFFIKEKFASYWYESGTPKFLLDLFKNRPEGYPDIKKHEMGEWSLNTFDINNVEIEPFLFQTGYLTIKKIMNYTGSPVYELDIPNYEVREALNLHILAEFVESGAPSAETAYRRIKDSLKTGNLDIMLVTLKKLFASIPYEIHMRHEYYYHSIFYAIINLLGFETDAEVSVSGGRIDAVLELEDKIYIIEFKYKGGAQNASPDEKRKLLAAACEEGMQQIKGKKYASKYIGGNKSVYLAAFAFLGRDEIDMKVELLYN